METSVLHPGRTANRDYRIKDLLNGKTGHLTCRFLEWSGWYNQELYQRLLGHYRLYQIFKKESKGSSELITPFAYIVHYRSTQSFKFLLSRVVSMLYRAGTFGGDYTPFRVETLNRVLLFQYPHLLEAFLHDAETDLEAACQKALKEIRQLNFHSTQSPKQYNFLLVRQEQNSYQTNQHYFIEQHLATPSPLKGKEKGVFSKKQIVILLDLLSESAKLERIDFSRPNKYDGLAELLFALTSKSKDSWVKELNQYKAKGLYDFQNLGELNQLIIILTNLAEGFRKAGFRSVSSLADKKLSELDKLKSKM